MPLEANRLGTPSVATNRGGLPDVVNDETDLVVEPNPSALTRALSRYINGGAVDACRIAELSLRHLEPEKSVKALFSFLHKFGV